jgi:hypothetical protein
MHFPTSTEAEEEKVEDASWSLEERRMSTFWLNFSLRYAPGASTQTPPTLSGGKCVISYFFAFGYRTYLRSIECSGSCDQSQSLKCSSSSCSSRNIIQKSDRQTNKDTDILNTKLCTQYSIAVLSKWIVSSDLYEAVNALA